MQDIEFTIEHGELFMLQTRTGKRTGPAAVRIAAEMVEEGLIDRRTALRRVEPQHLVQMLAPELDAEEKKKVAVLALGLPAGPGAASGAIAFTAERAAAIDDAAEALTAGYRANVFPSMKIGWSTYPNHIGHEASPGCFRCHDEAHAAPDGRTITQDCSTCHSLLAMGEEDPEILHTLSQ